MNGIYHVDFSSPLGSGSGTIYLENGILRGGDAAVAYCGTYLLDRDTLNAQAKIIKHGAGFSILGDATSLAFQGEISSGSISGTASIPGSNLQAKISLHKIAEF
ncbi:hypothetical protein [uncultured Desulfovibrio sp.]|uniref:hypothetical protein n=1 Tax=uncultured Desulfovibrio sp. TaxID=167968 RepID=UPI00258F611F|nr:hypothetical protein [uncultured Desulfovibrio sp.]